MNMKFLEFLKTKKQVMKLSAVAFVSVISMFGFSHGVSAMRSSKGPGRQKQRPGTSAVKKRRGKVPSSQEQSEVKVKRTKKGSAAKDAAAAKTQDDVEKFEQYKRDAEKGNAEAQYNLGFCYEEGIGVTKDEKKAFEWYQRAAEQGHATAQYNLGWCYENGRGVDTDAEKAAEWYQKAAKQEYAGAQNNLGMCYLTGIGVESDKSEAVKWFQKAADQGNIVAQYNLGICYEEGAGVDKDAKKAVEWYQRAADQGHAGAQNNLGVCYQNGIGVTKDEKKAVELYKLVADQGDAAAQNNLGDCYQKGIGVTKDEKKAFDLFQQAADQGYAAAQYNLGICYEEGIGGVRDKKKAVEWYQRAADQGHAGAQNNLGVCYQNGIGVESDAQKAVDLYQRASDQGRAAACKNLGWCYKNGIGVAQDEKKAVELYELAADQGYTAAQNDLGECYQMGTGVDKDAKKAVKWYQRAADQGYAEAQYNLGCCYKNGIGVDKDAMKAVEWYQRAADQGDAAAQNDLGECYQKGIGVTRDEKKAFDLFQQAADQGYAAAQNNLGLCYQYAIGVGKDEHKAFDLFQQAADQGCAEAQNNLGLCYKNGIAVDPDAGKVFEWFRKAADQKFAPAQNNLAWCYRDGIGVEKDEKKSIELLQSAADQGYDIAQNGLGCCYRDGRGVEQDAEKAFVLFQGAAAQGYAPAQNNLGMCYQYAIGVEQDEKKAFELYQRAADQGCADAQNNLGLCYQNGIGTEKNAKKAVELYQLAVSKGCAEAQNNLGLCFQEGIGITKDGKKAIELYQLAADQGYTVAWYHLGVCYECGIGVDQDYDQMIRLYKLAESHGDMNAKSRLEYYYGVVKEGDDFYEYIETIKQLKEDMNFLVFPLDVKCKQEKLKQIIEGLEKLKDLKLKVKTRYNELFSEYIYYKRALDFLNTKMKSDKKYAEEIYADMIAKFKNFETRKETTFNAFKAMKLYLYDIESLIPDLNDVCTLYGYFNLFGSIQSFIKNVGDIKFDDFNKITLSDEDMSNVSKLNKEDWMKEFEKMKYIALLNAYYGFGSKYLGSDMSVQTLKQLSPNDQEACFWIFKFVEPVLKDIVERKIKPNSKEVVKKFEARVRKMQNLIKSCCDESFNRGPKYLENIKAVYSFSNHMENSVRFDFYNDFLCYWDKKEKELSQNPVLKLNMMISNLDLYEKYVERLSNVIPELKERCENVKKNIFTLLNLLHSVKGKGEAWLIEWNSFNAINTRKVIRDLLCVYKAKLDELERLAKQSIEEDDAAKASVAEESPKEKVSDDEKSIDTAEQVASESEGLPEHERSGNMSIAQVDERFVREVPQKDLSKADQDRFDVLQERLGRYKMWFEELLQEHAKCLSRAYVRIIKGKVEEFAKKEEINRKILKIQDDFDKAENCEVEQIRDLEDILDNLPSSLGDIGELLSKAKNFMEREEASGSPKLEDRKEKGSSSPKVDKKEGKESGNALQDINGVTVCFANKKLERAYDEFIVNQVQTREEDFVFKVIRWLRSESSTDVEYITSVKEPYASCRYRDSGRICFRLDKDFKYNHTIHVICVEDNHKYGKVNRSVDGQVKLKS